MRSKRIRALVTGVTAVLIGICAQTAFSGPKSQPKSPVDVAVDKGIKWLISVQGKDGGWGQDGGETSYIRQGEHLESTGNDVANTAVAAEALLHAGNTPTTGPYHENLQRAVRFILERVEQSPIDGLAVTNLTGTQIQRKLGPYIDTFLTSKLMAELDGNMGDEQANARVRKSLEKCVAKVEKNQLKDGSWNVAGGWAPILGTSLASQSLFVAQGKGVAVSTMAMNRVETYTKDSAFVPPVMAESASRVESGAGIGTGSGGGFGAGSGAGIGGGSLRASAKPPAAYSASAGVSLYKGAQELEQLTRTADDRKKNAAQIATLKGQLSDPRFINGFGSIGGEEFFSYLNIGDSLHRAGGPEWDKWNGDMTAKVLKLQNEDGTWAGHHCITGRVAVTSAAVLMLLADREPVMMTKK
jgi:hypothetical protein